MTTLTPNLMTENVNEAVAFYRDHLGFRFVMGMPWESEAPITENPDATPLQWAMVTLDEVSVMFQARASIAEDYPPLGEAAVGASAALYLEVESLDVLLQRLNDGAEVVVPERVTFYGMREVWIRDNSGYLLVLAEKAAQGQP